MSHIITLRPRDRGCWLVKIFHWRSNESLCSFGHVSFFLFRLQCITRLIRDTTTSPTPSPSWRTTRGSSSRPTYHFNVHHCIWGYYQVSPVLDKDYGDDRDDIKITRGNNLAHCCTIFHLGIEIVITWPLDITSSSLQSMVRTLKKAFKKIIHI